MTEFASIEEAFQDFVDNVYASMLASEEKEKLKHHVSRFRLNKEGNRLAFASMKNVLEAYGYEVTTKTSKKNIQKVEELLLKARNLQGKVKC